MKSFAVDRIIAAPPERVWAIVTDAGRLSDGTFGIVRIDGEIGAGKSFRLWSEVDPRRAFALRVGEFRPPAAMEWMSGMPFGLFSGTRRFDFSPVAGGTRFSMRETYAGPLAGLIARAIPDLTPSFQKFADGVDRAARKEGA